MVCLVEYQQAACLQVKAQAEQADEAAGSGDEDAGRPADQRDALGWGGVIPVEHLMGDVMPGKQGEIHAQRGPSRR